MGQSCRSNYSLAIELSPNDADAYCFRGIAKLGLKDFKAAIADYNMAIKLNLNDAKDYYCRGLTKHLLGQKDSGCMDLSKAGELGYEKAYEGD